jgi:hypothetical protein
MSEHRQIVVSGRRGGKTKALEDNIFKWWDKHPDAEGVLIVDTDGSQHMLKRTGPPFVWPTGDSMKPEAFANRKVIWKATNPKGNEQFRIVDRAYNLKHAGAEARLEDNGPRYIAEQRKGHDSMGVERWGHVEVGSRAAFANALLAAYLDGLTDGPQPGATKDS